MQELVSLLYHQDSSRVTDMLAALKKVIEEDSRLTFFSEEICSLQEDFNRIADSFMQGVRDPYRKDIYHSLKERANGLAKNMLTESIRLNNQLYRASAKRANGLELCDISSILENHQSNEHELVDYQRIFASILVSYQWNGNMEVEMASVACQASYSEVAVLLMVSAITLSCMQVYDAHKISCLCRIYRFAERQSVKQRALVGVVFALSNEDTCLFYDRNNQLKVLATEEAREDLQNLQIQIIQAMETETLAKSIESLMTKDIMELVKKKRADLKEKLSETSIEEIIDADLDETIKEQMGDKIEKINEQRDAGFDVNYGSFCKMKSFGFFHQMANWFLPYYAENPDIQYVCSTFGSDAHVLGNVKNLFALSDGDKYSMLFMLEGLVRKMPSFKKVAAGLPIFEPQMGYDTDENEDPEQIRKYYLQDLFRFFHLAPMREGLENPFGENSKSHRKAYYFLHHPLFSQEIFAPIRNNVCRYLAKHRKFAELQEFIAPYKASNLEEYLLQSLCYIKVSKEYGKAIELLTPIVMMNPDNVSACRMLAQAYRLNENYMDALDTYMSLPSSERDKLSIRRSVIFCQIKCGKAEEALQGAYELDYNDPGCADNIELIVKAHFANHDYKKVLEQSKKLFEIKKQCHLPITAEDYCCLAISLWCLGSVSKAVKVLYQWIDTSTETNKFEKYLQLLSPQHLRPDHGILDTDIALMSDLVSERINKNNLKRTV